MEYINSVLSEVAYEKKVAYHPENKCEAYFLPYSVQKFT